MNKVHILLPMLAMFVLVVMAAAAVAIVASARIDTTRWSDQSLQDLETKRWNVPLEQPVNLNANSLRRRRVDGIRFRQNPTHWHIWVDAEGVQRHPDT